MHRLLVDADALSAARPALPEEARAHLKVVRPRDGEVFELFDGCGRTRPYAYDAAARQLVASGEVAERPRPLPLTLFACVTKGSRWDWTVEKATELGVTRLVPVLSERTVVRLAPAEREPKRLRWLRVAQEAARQSDAVWLPEIAPAVSFADSLALVRGTRCFAGIIARPAPRPILEAVRGTPRPAGGYALYVGPEGDFTPGEQAALRADAEPVSFGTTILRAETAALYGLSVLKAVSDVQAG